MKKTYLKKDFKVVLNSHSGKEEESDNMMSFHCDKCNFRATSNRCLYTHVIFVHDPLFYKCDICPMETRSGDALPHRYKAQYILGYRRRGEDQPLYPEGKARPSTKEVRRN